jgi:amino-acid N-acetyltransferase
MHTRKGLLRDVDAVYKLIKKFSPDGTLLSRSYAELSENIRDFAVIEDKGKIIGCGALHFYGIHLTEVRSFCVDPSAQGKGAGSLLMKALLDEAKLNSVRCVCLFTRIPDFFGRYGFKMATREELPDKIYKDCQKCPKLHACDEVAMYKGELPKIAILATPESVSVKELVQLRV